MTSQHRVVTNTLATYGRSLLSAGLGIFASRWVLQGLGQTDFGLFALIGTVIGFVSVLNSVLGATVARHFAFAIGRGDSRDVNRWFNTALAVHVVVPAGLVAIGLPLGVWCIRHVLVTPEGRVDDCLWVFRLSLVSAFAQMVAVPFVAMFIAQQRMKESALWGLLQAILLFVLAMSLAAVDGDRLLVYTAGVVSIYTAIAIAQMFRAWCSFPECRLDRGQWVSAHRITTIFSFAGWTTIGTVGSLFRSHGIAILLNLFHGPRLNAAYGIANQVSLQTGTFAQAMIGAIAPEIAATAGRGDRQRVANLAVCASKLATLLALLFAVPLLVETEYILDLWLSPAPAYASVFCQIVLISFILDKSSVGYVMAINAQGRIAAYQATVGGLLLLAVPLGYVFLKAFKTPTAAMMAFLATSLLCTLLRVMWGRRLLGIPVRHWLAGVVLRCTCVVIPSLAIAALPHLWLPKGGVRFVLSLALSLSTSALLSFYIALTPGERTLTTQYLRKLWMAVAGIWSGTLSVLPRCRASRSSTWAQDDRGSHMQP